MDVQNPYEDGSTIVTRGAKRQAKIREFRGLLEGMAAALDMKKLLTFGPPPRYGNVC